MARIPMPPPAVAERHHKYCLPFGEDLYIDFIATGYFGPVEDGIFNPDIPAGLFPAGSSIGPFKARHNNTEVDLVFIEPGPPVLGFLETVQIKTRC